VRAGLVAWTPLSCLTPLLLLLLLLLPGACRYGDGGSGREDPFGRAAFTPFHLQDGGPEQRHPSRSSFSYGGASAAPEVAGLTSLYNGELARDGVRPGSGRDTSEGPDAAAIAVDMVSLARANSRRLSSAVAVPGGGGAGTSIPEASAVVRSGGSPRRQQQQQRAVSLPRAGSRGLGTRSMGMLGAYGGPQQLPGSSGESELSDFQQPQQQQRMLRASSAAFGQGAGQRTTERSLSTRSSNPHLPRVGPVAPSLYTISTGLAAYGSRGAAQGASAAAGGGSGADGSSGSRAGGGLPWAGSMKAERGLASQSVPAAGIVAAAAAAAAAVGAGSKAAAAGGSSSGLGRGSTGGGSTGSASNLLSMLRTSIGLGRGSALSGKATGGGLLRSSTDGESSTGALGKLSGPHRGGVFPGFGEHEGAADLADARSWLVTGVCWAAGRGGCAAEVGVAQRSPAPSHTAFSMPQHTHNTPTTIPPNHRPEALLPRQAYGGSAEREWPAHPGQWV
jgi:hypothetical protein